MGNGKRIMSGIYKILNIKTGDFYIGSSYDINKRIKTHFHDLKTNKHHSIIFQRAYKKYKRKSFIVIILEECSIDNLIIRENFYLKSLNPVYNISKDALSPMKGRKHKKSTLLKFKKRKIKSGKEHYLYGKKRPRWAVIKSANANTGLKRNGSFKKLQSKHAIKLQLHKCLLPFIEKCKRKIKDNKGNKFNSLVEAGKYWNISAATVCDILKGRHSFTRKGVSFIYA